MAFNAEVNNDEVTHEIIGVAIEIHKALGSDYSESTYRDVLAEGLRQSGFDVKVEHEVAVEIFGFKGAKRRVDILVEDDVVLELKVLKSTNEAHLEQLGTNVEAAGASRGLLLNFGAALLEKRRYATAEWLEEQRTGRRTGE